MADISEDLPPCEPGRRNFPLAWKEAYFRLHFNTKVDGYVCPGCRKVFRGPKGFKELKADHVYPFSQGGLTTWNNLQLLCWRCNSKKSDTVLFSRSTGISES